MSGITAPTPPGPLPAAPTPAPIPSWNAAGSPYAQSTTVQSRPNPYVQAAKEPGAYASLYLANLPLLRDQDDTGGAGFVAYYCACAYGQISRSTLQMSADGTSYNAVDVLSNTASWGTCLNALPPTVTPFATDNTSQLTIAMVTTTLDLESVSWLYFVNGANAALVGQEIIQFRNASYNNDGTITLSTFTRGRRGTEWACGTHVAGEKIIILDTSWSMDVLALARIGAPEYFKLQPPSTTLDSVAAVSFTFLGMDRKPYAPVNFQRQPSGPDLAVGWFRRTRMGGQLQDGLSSVPLCEQSESYDAYILAAPYNGVAANRVTPASFVRSFLGLTVPALLYTAAEMAADGFVPSTSTLHLVVFQNSATVGHGLPGACDLPPY